MAKKQEQIEEEVPRNRRDILRERKAQAERNQIRNIVLAVVGFLVLILLAAVIIEFAIRPGQAVATVDGEVISLRQWEDRVRYQRAQLIISLEEITELQNGDIGLTQQFASQQIQILAASQADTLGQLVLDQMIDELLIRQEAERRGLSVTEAEVDEVLAEGYNYFNGDSPTPFPTGTATVAPTPSLTPIPTEVITEVVPSPSPFPTATMGPTSTPRPTATPVSEDAFLELLNEDLMSFDDLGIAEETYRAVIEAQLYAEKLRDVLADEAEVPEEGLHVSVFALYFGTQEEADAALAEINSSDYLTVWNEIRSAPAAPPAEDGTAAPRVTEFLWRNEESLATTLNEDIAAQMMELDLETSTEVIELVDANGLAQYIILQASGREIRDFTTNKIDADRSQVLTDWIDEQRLRNVQQTELWRNRVPSRPQLNTDYFIAQPTFTTEPIFLDPEG